VSGELTARAPRASAIATGRGDDGTTGLLYGGDRIPKDDLRTEAYGAVDEAVAALGIARAELSVMAQDDALDANPRLHRLNELVLRIHQQPAQRQPGHAGCQGDEQVHVAGVAARHRAEHAHRRGPAAARQRSRRSALHYPDVDVTALDSGSSSGSLRSLVASLPGSLTRSLKTGPPLWHKGLVINKLCANKGRACR